MAKARKIKIEVTEAQLGDIVTMLEHGICRVMGYGHVTHREQALREANRKRLTRKLNEQLVAHRQATCPQHYEDNQGYCHCCGLLLNPEEARRQGYID